MKTNEELRKALREGFMEGQQEACKELQKMVSDIEEKLRKEGPPLVEMKIQANELKAISIMGE